MFRRAKRIKEEKEEQEEYDTLEIENQLDNDEITSEEAGFWAGWLSCDED